MRLVLIWVFTLLIGFSFSLVKYISPYQAYYLNLLQPFFPLFFFWMFGVVLYSASKRKVSLLILSLTFTLFNASDLTSYLPTYRGIESSEGQVLVVLSYNTSFFYAAYQEEDQEEFHYLVEKGRNIKKWIKQQKVDVLCFQEYYIDSLSNEFRLDLDLKDYPYQYQMLSSMYTQSGFGGLSIFSKHEIVNEGVVFQGDWKKYNGAIFTDIKVNGDTVRIINSHLHSMGLYNPIKTPNPFKTIKTNLNAVRVGSFIRQKQLKYLNTFVRSSRYPVILSIDMNETPHSFAYHQVDAGLSDSFRRSGTGFGFSLNKGFLKHLRIDYQFYNDKVQSQKLVTDRTIELSDHYPLTGNYLLKED